jgi:hypothetical protein
LSVTPLIERERVSDPTIEAAKIAAKRFFSKPGSPQSALKVAYLFLEKPTGRPVILCAALSFQPRGSWDKIPK